MPLRKSSLLGIAALLGACMLHAASPSNPDQWKDGRGKTFKGRPLAIVGPYAVFAKGEREMLTIRLRAFTPEDCVRIHHALLDRPGRVADWAQTRSSLNHELVTHAQRLATDSLAPATWQGRAEPELILLIAASFDQRESKAVLDLIKPAYERLRAQYGDQFEAVFLGLRHDAAKHQRMIVEQQMPWLVVDFARQGQLNLNAKYGNVPTPYLAVLTRDGHLLEASARPNLDGAKAVLSELESLLAVIQPGSAKAALDRKHYLSAVQPVIYQDARSNPVLIATPLEFAALRHHGMTRLVARIEVASDGAVRNVTVADDQQTIAPELKQAIAEGLARSVFVAAVENGRFIDSDYMLRIDLTR